MENVLDVYQRPSDPRRPVVAMDEQPEQLIRETRTPWPCRPGAAAKVDDEYRRPGIANVWMFSEPLTGWRSVNVTPRRTAIDWAHQMRDMVDVHDPEAERITVVLDNLNTHHRASLYAAFEPAEAQRIARRLALVDTPKHGSWLNVAEIELSVLSRQCLARRMSEMEMIQQQAQAWATRRNAEKSRIDWRFTTDKARIKLKRLDPRIEG